MANITKEQIENLKASLQGIVESEENGEMLDSIISLLSLPEDQFMILAPGIMQSFQQSLNNPNDKIALVQAINAHGMKAEDITGLFEEIEASIDDAALSVQKRDFLKEMMVSIINALNDTEGISKRMVGVAIELCDENAKIPQYAHTTDSGMDLYAIEDITIHPGETKLVHTGVKIALPVGYELQVRPKSGRTLGSKMRVGNSPGTIDQGYRDEIRVIIDNIEPPIKNVTAEPVFNEDGTIKYMNITSIEYGSDMHIGKGEKFAQLVLAEVPKVAFYRVDSVKDIGEDRNGGFGSTGLV